MSKEKKTSQRTTRGKSLSKELEIHGKVYTVVYEVCRHAE